MSINSWTYSDTARLIARPLTFRTGVSLQRSRRALHNVKYISNLDYSLRFKPDTYLAFDIIGEVVFSEPFGCLDEGEATEWARGNQ